MSSLQLLLQHQVVAIVRGIAKEHIIDIAYALYEGGIRNIEVTLNTPDAILIIEKLAQQIGDKMLVGAGTVLSTNEAANAISAGAQFILSPSLDPDIISTTKKAGKISIPGAFTATEIVNAHKMGADIIKVFPCPGPDYIKNILAPLNHLKLMPTGGVNGENIYDYKKAGAVAFGIGSSLVFKAPVNDAYLEKITLSASNLLMHLNKA